MAAGTWKGRSWYQPWTRGSPEPGTCPVCTGSEDQPKSARQHRARGPVPRKKGQAGQLEPFVCQAPVLVPGPWEMTPLTMMPQGIWSTSRARWRVGEDLRGKKGGLGPHSSWSRLSVLLSDGSADPSQSRVLEGNLENLEEGPLEQRPPRLRD